MLFPKMTSQQNELGGNFVKTIIALLFEIINAKQLKSLVKKSY